MNSAARFMIISSFAFSLMHICVKALPHIPVFELVFFRSFISLILCFFTLKKRKVAILGLNRKVLFARGFLGTLALSLFFVTLQNLPLAGAVTIQYLSPVFTSIFAIWLLKEKVKQRQWGFFLIAFLGLIMLKGFDLSGRISLNFVALGVLSACFSGLAYNCIRFLRETENPLVVVFYFPLIATPITGFFTCFQWVSPKGWDWIFLLFLGLLTQLAQIFMTKGIQGDLAGNIMSYKYIGVLFAFLYGYFFFGETYSVISIFGVLLLLLGIILNVVYKNKEAL